MAAKDVFYRGGQRDRVAPDIALHAFRISSQLTTCLSLTIFLRRGITLMSNSVIDFPAISAMFFQ
jgi:hypothetical protein